MTQPIQIGLIGCGALATHVHLPILRELSGVQVVSLADSDERRLQEATRLAPGASAHRKWSDMLRDPQVQGVVICLPSAMHAECALAAIECGKHVYIEKPLATDLNDARTVVDAWRRGGRVGIVGFNYRFNPLYDAIRRQLAGGRIGTLQCVRSVFSTGAKSLPAWKRSRDTGGGVLLDLASHHIDLIGHVTGRRVREVFARVQSLDSEADTATLELHLDGGVSAQSFFSLASIEEDRVELYGSAGRLTVDRYGSLDVEYASPIRRNDRVKRAFEGIFKMPRLLGNFVSGGAEPSYQIALNRFIDAARTGRQTGPDLDDGYRCLAIVIAAEQSAATGKLVQVHQAHSTPDVMQSERIRAEDA